MGKEYYKIQNKAAESLPETRAREQRIAARANRVQRSRHETGYRPPGSETPIHPSRMSPDSYYGPDIQEPDNRTQPDLRVDNFENVVVRDVHRNWRPQTPVRSGSMDRRNLASAISGRYNGRPQPPSPPIQTSSPDPRKKNRELKERIIWQPFQKPSSS